MSRRKGQASIKTIDAQKLAQELDIDPFEILLLFAANKWEELGYMAPTRTVRMKSGDSYETDTITAETRVTAAKDAASYLLPKRKAVEFTPADIPDEVFKEEVQRRINLRILKGEKIG